MAINEKEWVHTNPATASVLARMTTGLGFTTKTDEFYERYFSALKNKLRTRVEAATIAPLPASAPNQLTDPDRLELAADQAIEACSGDAREAVKALVVGNEFLEQRLQELASPSYACGRVLPRDRKDWYD